LVGRYGSRAMTARAGLVLCLALPLPALAPSVPLLALALFVFGASNALLDVSMNAQAVVVEAQYRRAVLSSVHRPFQLGGLAGAAVAGLALALGRRPLAHVVGVAAAGASSLAVALGGLVPSARAERRGPVFARPTGVLLALGGLAFLGLLAEGAMADWS